MTMPFSSPLLLAASFGGGAFMGAAVSLWERFGAGVVLAYLEAGFLTCF